MQNLSSLTVFEKEEKQKKVVKKKNKKGREGRCKYYIQKHPLNFKFPKISIFMYGGNRPEIKRLL